MTVALARPPVAAAASAHPDKIETVLPPFTERRIPVQPTIELERLYRKQRLAAGYRLFGRYGFDMGGAGHITARDPEHPDQFWVNPLGVHFSRIKVSDLMLVSHEGEIVQPPKKAAPRLNRARLRDPFRVAQGPPRRGGRGPFPLVVRQGLVGAGATARTADPGFGGLLRRSRPVRGIFRRGAGSLGGAQDRRDPRASQGRDPAEPRHPYRRPERGRRRLALPGHGERLPGPAAGRRRRPTKPMPEAVARHTAGQVGSEVGGFYAFQPYWDVVSEEEPDLFD